MGEIDAADSGEPAQARQVIGRAHDRAPASSGIVVAVEAEEAVARRRRPLRTRTDWGEAQLQGEAALRRSRSRRLIHRKPSTLST
jgi:hypothetical protein